LELSAIAFLLVTLFAILVMNLFFNAIYFANGLVHFAGFITATAWGQLKEIFYFSAQTFTKVGYGHFNLTNYLGAEPKNFIK
jgi:inward rectifier potassium channel